MRYENGKTYVKYLGRIAEYLGESRKCLLEGIDEVSENKRLIEKGAETPGNISNIEEGRTGYVFCVKPLDL